MQALTRRCDDGTGTITVTSTSVNVPGIIFCSLTATIFGVCLWLDMDVPLHLQVVIGIETCAYVDEAAISRAAITRTGFCGLS